VSDTSLENPAATLRSCGMIATSTTRRGRTTNQSQPNAQGNLNVTGRLSTQRFKQNLPSSKQL
jgi:hypothetical protein